MSLRAFGSTIEVVSVFYEKLAWIEPHARSCESDGSRREPEGRCGDNRVEERSWSVHGRSLSQETGSAMEHLFANPLAHEVSRAFIPHRVPAGISPPQTAALGPTPASASRNPGNQLVNCHAENPRRLPSAARQISIYNLWRYRL
jgi:hypothetical protein